MHNKIIKNTFNTLLFTLCGYLLGIYTSFDEINYQKTKEQEAIDILYYVIESEKMSLNILNRDSMNYIIKENEKKELNTRLDFIKESITIYTEK